MQPTDITIASVLGAAVITLWKYMQSSIGKLQKRSDECERDRAGIHAQLEKFGNLLSIFKACPADPCPAKKGVEKAETFNVKGDQKIE